MQNNEKFMENTMNITRFANAVTSSFHVYIQTKNLCRIIENYYYKKIIHKTTLSHRARAKLQQ